MQPSADSAGHAREESFTSPAKTRLPGGESVAQSADIHVWLVPLSTASSSQIAKLQPEELRLAAVLNDEEEKNRFIVSRLALRALIGRHMGAPLAQVRIERGPQGAPMPAGTDWRCSMSHSGRWIVIGLCHHFPIGVDIEAIRDIDDAMLIARDRFHPAEQELIDMMHGGSRTVAFLRIWVRKKAVVKASRQGPVIPLLNWHALREWREDSNDRPFEVRDWESRIWSVSDLDVDGAHIAALATTALVNDVRVRRASLAELVGPE
jgi:phosphopantetheinyl transferase